MKPIDFIAKGDGRPAETDAVSPGIRAWTVHLGNEELAVIAVPSLLSAVGTTLTPAEEAIAQSVAQGETTHDIARGRGTSARTVENQLASIYRKLNLGSRQELAVLFSAGPILSNSAGSVAFDARDRR